MAGGGPSIGSYSPLAGFVFIFNLCGGWRAHDPTRLRQCWPASAFRYDWIVPTFLVFCLRRRLAVEWKQMHPMEVAVMRPGSASARGNKNRFASPFAHQTWLYLVLGFSLLSVALITITHGMH